MSMYPIASAYPAYGEYFNLEEDIMAVFDYSGMDPRMKKYGITASAIEKRAKELRANNHYSEEECRRLAVLFLCDSADQLEKYEAHITWQPQSRKGEAK